MKTNNKYKNGFTLVECVVALAIISVITAVAVVVFSSSIKSVNDQWDKYCVTVGADNILSCFQASENADAGFNESMVKLGFAESEGLSKKEEFSITDYVKYDEYDVSTKMVPVPFKTVRAFENGEISLYNCPYSDISDTTLSVTDFIYSGDADQLKYSQEKTVFNNKVVYTEKATGGEEISSITVYYYGTEETMLYNYYYWVSYTVFRDTDGKIKTTIYYDHYQKGNISGNISNVVNVEFTREAFQLEQYLFTKGQVLVFVSNLSVSDYMFFSLYQCNGERVLEDNKYVYVAVYGSMKNKTDDWNEGMYLNVSDVKKYKGSRADLEDLPRFPSPSLTDILDESGKTFSGMWYGLPCFFYENNSLVDSLNKTGKASGHVGSGSVDISGPIVMEESNSKYVDYYVNNSYPSDICFVIKKVDNLDIYNSSGNLLYTYSGCKIDNLINSLDFELDSSYDVVGAERYCRYQSDIIITGIRIYETDKKISFYSGVAGSELFCFRYDSPVVFQNDVSSIQTGGSYCDFYNNNGDSYVLKNPDAGSLLKIEGGYNVSVDNKVIFTAHTLNVETKYTNLDDTGEGFVEVESESKGFAVTRWYSYVHGNYAFISEVTFSEYASISGIQPQIRTWIVSKSVYNTWKKNGIVPMQEVYYQYKKG